MGSDLRFKMWEREAEEPTEWMIQCKGPQVDTGKISFQFYAAGGAMSLDNIQVTNVNFDEVVVIKEIEAVEQLEGIKVPEGTAFQTLPLPETVTVTLKSGERETVRVVWDSAAYRPNEEGVQLLTGTLKIPYDILNPKQLQASVEVIQESPVCNHSGGTATCKSQAICERCGEPYGEKNPNNHVGGTEVKNIKEATYTENGYTGDTFCKGCEKMLEQGTVIPKREWPVNPDVPHYPVEPFRPETKPALPFVDVPAHQWYYDSVYSAWEKDLIDGMDQTHFAPDSTLTVAQAIKLAAATHQRDKLGKVTLENGTEQWYTTYVNYAIANDIIEEAYADYAAAQMNAAITRSEFVKIFHGAMDFYAAINEVADNAIPDVKMQDKYAAEIYEFYRAGILTGSDEKGAFYPNTHIKRSEVATILVRMFDMSARVRIDLK